MAAFGTEGCDFAEVFPGITANLLTLEGHFWVPGIRYVLAAKEPVFSLFSSQLNYILMCLLPGSSLCTPCVELMNSRELMYSCGVNVFQLTYSRELMYSCGACAATKRSIEYLLGRPSGVAAILVVGGAREALFYSTEK